MSYVSVLIAGARAKVIATALVVGAVGVVAGFGTWSAFSSTTSNDGNTFAAGTVSLADNDGGSAMYAVSNQKPGVTTVKCIKVTYTGSLDADVKLYTTSTLNSGAQYFDLTIEKGTSTSSTFPDCGTFASESTLYSGTLANFVSSKNSYENGIAANPGVASKWAQNDSLVYRFTVSVQDNNNAQSASSGSHSFTWEARNQ